MPGGIWRQRVAEPSWEDHTAVCRNHTPPFFLRPSFGTCGTVSVLPCVTRHEPLDVEPSWPQPVGENKICRRHWLFCKHGQTSSGTPTSSTRHPWFGERVARSPLLVRTIEPRAPVRSPTDLGLVLAHAAVGWPLREWRRLRLVSGRLLCGGISSQAVVDLRVGSVPPCRIRPALAHRSRASAPVL